MKKNMSYLEALYEIINSDIDEVLEEVKPYEDKIQKMINDFDKLIKKNLAEAKISRGRAIQKKFDEDEEFKSEFNYQDLLVAARANNNEISELKLSEEEIKDLHKLHIIKKKDDKSR